MSTTPGGKHTLNQPTKQCPCEKPLSKKHIVEYNFGISGIVCIYVCTACLVQEPYSKCILKVDGKIDY